MGTSLLARLLAAALIDVDHVEVLRGPQGTLYGRDTTRTAFSLYTKNPTDRRGVPDTRGSPLRKCRKRLQRCERRERND
jgi:outer membrane receptor protein involved in Fe transport